jgi:hypothetical protein
MFVPKSLYSLILKNATYFARSAQIARNIPHLLVLFPCPEQIWYNYSGLTKQNQWGIRKRSVASEGGENQREVG